MRKALPLPQTKPILLGPYQEEESDAFWKCKGSTEQEGMPTYPPLRLSQGTSLEQRGH